MTDDLKNFGARDRHRIDVDDEWEFRYWCDQWEVSAERLREAVKKVGPLTDDVARELGRSA